MESHPQDVQILRSGGLLFIGALERRQRKALHRKYEVLRIGDRRLPERERISIAEKLVNTPRCCANRELARCVRRLALDAAAREVALESAGRELGCAEQITLRSMGA